MRRPFVRLAALALLGAAACSQDTLPTVSRVAESADSHDGERTPTSLTLEKIGGFDGGATGASEITAFDERSARLFVVNGALGSVDVLDLSRPEAPTRVTTLAFGGSANSVAVHRGLVAIAVQAADKTMPGTVEFYRARNLEPVASTTVGALPDMVMFTAKGNYVLVANEGEPNDAYTVDPEGTVTIIEVKELLKSVVDEDDDDDRRRAGGHHQGDDHQRGWRRPAVARTVSFAAYNGQADALRAQGIRIYGPNASVAQDLEPEYITADEEEETAWVTLQENNALAVIDIGSARVKRLIPLGFKDHTLPGNGFDASDRDNAVNIRNWPVLGMYQPDAIASFQIGRRTYLITANEGDARDYAGFAEESRVGALALDPAIFTDAVCGGPCRDNARLGRLTVTRTLGLDPATGLYEKLYVLGARSFSIWSEDGTQLFDSGDQLEQLTEALPNVNFNASNTGNTLDDRSDNKGPEPEGVAIGRIGKKTFAFLGLERVGGVMVYDVSVPTSPSFVTYINTRDGATGDLGPEGIIFVAAKDSPNKRPLVIVGNEISGTTAIYQVLVQ